MCLTLLLFSKLMYLILLLFTLLQINVSHCSASLAPPNILDPIALPNVLDPIALPNVLDPIVLPNVLDPIALHLSSPMCLILLLCILPPKVLDPIALYPSLILLLCAPPPMCLILLLCPSSDVLDPVPYPVYLILSLTRCT